MGTPILQCLLWDFGDTLCDELSFFRGSPEWMAVYRTFYEPDGIGAAWSVGKVTMDEVVAELAGMLPLSEAEIQGHFGRVELLELFPFTYAFFRACHLPQAVVTVNPAEFRDLANKLRLGQVAETIVVSGEEGSDDKGLLCELALQRMSRPFDKERALLIDNRRDNLEAWVSRGGVGYHYTTDEAFERDVADGVDGLLASPAATRP